MRHGYAGYVGTPERARVLAGSTLIAAGAVALLGITTAEALFPEVYTTHANEISDLAGRDEDGAIRLASWLVFNGAMVVAGLLLGFAAIGLRTGMGVPRVTRAVALLAVGTVGVGVFPDYFPTLHKVFAGMTFISGGVAGVLVAQATGRPFGYASAALGVVALVALDIVVFGKSTFIYSGLGPGGIERWVSYPIVLWQVAFGSYLLGSRAPVGPRHPRLIETPAEP